MLQPMFFFEMEEGITQFFLLSPSNHWLLHVTRHLSPIEP